MADRPEAEYLTRGYTGRLFLGVSIAWFVLAFGRQLLPPLLPSIISDLGISSFRAGVALTGLLALRGLSHYPGGRLSDQLSRKTVLVGALATVSAGFVLLSVSTVYPLFVFAVMVIGTGAGAYVITARSTAADLYIEKRGQAFGLQNAFTNVAGVASAGGAVVVLAVGTSRCSCCLPWRSIGGTVTPTSSSGSNSIRSGRFVGCSVRRASGKRSRRTCSGSSPGWG